MFARLSDYPTAPLCAPQPLHTSASPGRESRQSWTLPGTLVRILVHTRVCTLVRTMFGPVLVRTGGPYVRVRVSTPVVCTKAIMLRDF